LSREERTEEGTSGEVETVRKERIIGRRMELLGMVAVVILI
jgi:hypothetical protein